MTLVLKVIMFLVQKIRNEEFDYLSVPDEVLSWVKVDRIMKFGHVFPSVLIAVLFTLKVLPLFSVSYAEQLEQNTTIIPITIVSFLIPILLLNGIIIEVILEKSNSEYKKLKNNKK